MPELVTKYTDVALKILKDAHIDCGTGKQPTILTHCPKDRFCSLPTGELCIYSVKETNITTQLTPFDFISLSYSLPVLAVIGLVFIIGLVAGMYWSK